MSLSVSNAVNIAVADLIPEEGCALVAYYDTNGWAIGYGNHDYADGSPVQQGDTITQAAALQLVSDIALGKWGAIQPCITVPMNDNQAAALIQLAYNCGEGVVCGSNLLALINAGAAQADIDAAWETTCVTSKGVYLSSLYNRRLSDMSLFDTAIAYAESNPGPVIATAAILVAAIIYYTIRIKRDYFSKK